MLLSNTRSGIREFHVLEEAFLGFSRGIQDSLWERPYQLCGRSDIFIAINSWWPRHSGPSETAHSFAATDSLYLLLVVIVGPTCAVLYMASVFNIAWTARFVLSEYLAMSRPRASYRRSRASS